ncbi:TRAP transporter small permease [Azospirillum sp. ST 5-10]|uniref:TRAP transporter small permease n=1 Tax=unclassified Azospirillum TaxID=2630922 RepID=UPI003F4A360D
MTDRPAAGVAEQGEGPAPAAGLAPVKAALGWLDRLTYGVIVVVMAAMAIIVSLQVFWRYVLGSSIDSADELSRLFFVWAIFLAIPHGVKYGMHVGIDLLVTQLPRAAQDALFRAVAAAGALLMLVVLTVAWTATLDKWPELMPTLPVSAGIYYVAVLACTVHSFLHLSLLAWGGPRTWEGDTL